jgi:putative CocE/NonD family hydrolase
VPYTQTVTTGMTKEYMTDDQRFASRRPDVLAYQTEPLKEAVTIAGPIMADLWVSTSGTDSDWVVKLIDVYPSDAEDPEEAPDSWHLCDAQLMVRSEVIRGRYRNSYERPEPFVPNEPANAKVELLDVLHTFRPGHRIMVQIQSTWFPMVDLNPQKYVPNINFADESDFVKATQRVYHSPQHATRLHVRVLPQSASEAEEVTSPATNDPSE